MGTHGGGAGNRNGARAGPGKKLLTFERCQRKESDHLRPGIVRKKRV